MSTGKTFALAIALKASIDGSIAAGLAKSAQAIHNVAQTANTANAELQQGTAALRGYEAQLAQIGAQSAEFMKLKRSIQDTSGSLTEARTRAATLARAFKESEQETAMLKARVDQAKESLERMKGTLTPATYRAAKAELKQLTAAYSESAARTRELGREFDAAKKDATNLKNTLSSQQTALQGVRTSLAEAGISTKNFAESQRAAQEALQKTIDKEKAAIAHQEKMAGLRDKRQGASEKFTAARGNLVDAVMLAGTITAPLIESTQEAIKFESVMADVRKVVDFDTPEQFKAMSGDILKLSTELPMAAEGIAKIVAAGGQSGIAREDLLAFAESATKMGIAFDITADQAGDMMAKWRTAFKMNQEEVVALADKVNYLGNTTAASAPLISDVVTRIGPLGEVGGVASGEIAALGASMVGVGIPSEVAATGIKNLILGMSAGAGATKSQADAFASLGMSAEEMASRMQVDAKGAIIDVMKAIRELDKDKQAATLQDLFGKESISAIAPLLGNLENLQENFDKVADAAKYAGSMEAEYAARSQTTENQIQLAKNAMDALQINIGSALLPTIGKIMEVVAPILIGFAEWASKNEELIIILAGVGAAIAALVVGIAVMTLAVQGIALAYASLQLAAEFVKGLQLATKIATAAQWAWNVALSANPIGLVILAIAALIAVIVLVVANFDKLKETASIVFSHISGTVAAMVATVKEKFSEALNKITEVWNSVTGQSLQSSNIIGAIFNELGFLMGAAFDVAAGIIGTAVSVIINLIVSMAQIIGGVVNVIVGIFTLDWDRAWKGAGQVVEGVVGTTIGTIKNLASGVSDLLDTLMGKSAEVQRQAEQAQARHDAVAAGRNALPQINSDYMPDEGMMQTAAAAQQTAQATAEASAHAQTLTSNVQQTGQAAQMTTDYMQQLQNIVGQVPSQTENTFQQLPPMAQQRTDDMAQEFSQLAAKCQPGGAAFVQAASDWGQEAYQAIDHWTDQMASVVENKMSNVWARISSQFSAGLNVNVTMNGGGSIAHNAKGGIYQRGAFLTTFAEDSPEAAIPIDGSARAANLWRQTGEMLGLLPKQAAAQMMTAAQPQLTLVPPISPVVQETAAAQMMTAAQPQLTLVPPISPVVQETAAAQMMAAAQPQLALVPPISPVVQETAAAQMMTAAQPQLALVPPSPVMSKPPQSPISAQRPAVSALPSSGGVTINYNPTIHIDGTADAGVVEQLRAELERQKQELIAMFPTLLKRQDAHERRLSYA